MIDFASNAKALFQMELRTTADKTVSLTDSLVQHVESVLTESAHDIVMCFHRFNSTQVDVVDRMLKTAMSDGNPYVRYRIGLSTPTEQFWLPWQEHQIVHYSAIIKGIGDNAGHNFEISTADRLYTLNRTTRIRSRQGTVSGIVQQIAQDAGLDCVAETTVGTFSYVQVNESDVEFITRRLIPRAVNDKGRGQYRLFIRDNVVHFHSPDYQTTIRQLSYYDVPHLGMIQIDRSQQLWDNGAAGTRMIVYDPYSGESKEISSDPEKHLRMADGIYLLNKVKDGQQTLLYHLGGNQMSEASAITQNVYSSGRSDTFEVNIDVSKSITVRLGDILQFILAPQIQKASPWSGYYCVVALKRTVSKESLRTVYTLKRGEIARDKTTITQPNSAAQLIPETTAPGQDINAATTQKSVLTAGVGKQESATVYSTVADRNSAPGT